DLAALDVAASVREMINPPIMALRELPVPVVARVHGPAAGIGFSYVLAADIRVASEAAKFAQTFIRVGLMPDGGSTFFLPRLVGYARAFELMTTGGPLTAHDAYALGIVNGVVPFDQLDATVDDIAARLAAGPHPSLAGIKAALSRTEAAELAAALDFEAEGQAACFASADFREGITAFLQKRPADFGNTKD
ncbi:MAG TPA: enoyl-CoA hydratase-related protein, partial [Pyrinomonadaceae bacterium]|nr:enoyl-CoA hydratase-related protein [Pyrinomonadaceae bacterium]